MPIEPAVTPAIWNPNAAANWCLLFSPAFGAFLQARNAETLGRTDEAASQWRWFYGTIAYFVITLFDIFLPLGIQMFSRVVGLAILLAWYFTLGRKQAQFVKATYGDAYQRKSWKTPLLTAFASLVGFMIVAAIMTMVARVFFGYTIV